jgi:nucleotide-binding universal stress UspA family protein
MSQTGFRPKRILVHLDTTADHWPALTRAVHLAKVSGGSVRLVDVLAPVPWHVPKGKSLQALLQKTMKARLAEGAALARKRGAKVTTALLEGDVADQLVEAATSWRADVVLRSHGVTKSKPRPIGPTDSQLLRRCPSPIWFVTPRQADGERVVVAAVSPDPANPARHELSVRVARVAASVAEATGAKLHVVHAWTAYGHQLLVSHASSQDALEYAEACRVAAQERFDALVSDAKLPASARTHLVEGPSDDALSKFIERRRTSLVVLGTVGRTGLAGLVVGNTAERILRGVRCSVLALKPSGFAEAMVESR